MKKTKKINRIMSVILPFIMIFCLAGCGNAAPAIGEDVVVSTEENGETIVGSNGEDDTKGAKEETEINDGEMAGTSGEEEPAITASSEPTPTATPEPTPTPTPTPEPHSHQYTETITRQPSCSEEGEKTLICSCGDSKTETVPPTGNHNWVEGTNTIHHEAMGHVEQRETQVQTGSRKYQVYECALCGFQSDTASGVTDHRAEYAAQGIRHTGSTLIYDYDEPVYETRTEAVWIVDQESWDEVVGSGTYTCTICGTTK